MQSFQVPDGLFHPQPHLLGRDRLAAIAAVPAHNVKITAGCRALSIDRFIGLLPIAEMRSLGLGFFGLALTADDITQELLLLGSFIHRDQCVLYPLMSLSHRLNLAGLNAETSDLELLV